MTLRTNRQLKPAVEGESPCSNINLIIQLSSRGAEENPEDTYTGQKVSQSMFEVGTSRTEIGLLAFLECEESGWKKE
jgi:hypothetical protein